MASLRQSEESLRLFVSVDEIVGIDGMSEDEGIEGVHRSSVALYQKGIV